MTAAASQNLPADLAAYSTSWDHLSDELRCLDLRLRQQVLKQPRPQASDPLSPFKGLVVTDQEVAELLAQPGDLTSGSAFEAEQHKLVQTLVELQARIQQRR